MAWCVAASPVLAQSKSQTKPAPKSQTKPAPGPSKDRPKDKEPPREDVAQAEARFFEGQKLYQQEKWHDALTEFRASYEYVPSPNSLLYVARCYRELNQVATAYDTYAKLIAEAGTNKKYAATKKAAEEEQAELANRVGRIYIDMPEDVGGARVRVGYRNIDSSMYEREVTVEAGKVTVHVEAPGHKPFDWDGAVSAGDTKRIEVVLLPDKPGQDEEDKATKPPRPPTRMHPLRPWAFVAGGVGVLGMINFGIFGTMASDRFDDLERSCDGRCPSARQDEVDAGRRETTAANISLLVGVVGFGAGVTILLLTPDQPLTPPKEQGSPTTVSKSQTKSAPAASMRLAPFDRAPGMALRGAF